jgi:dihydroorotate dehydrogenase
MVSALLRHGPAYVASMRRAPEQWMEWNKLTRLDDVRGRSSLQNTRDRAAF